MSDLPPGWAQVPLGEIADVRLGRQRSPKNHSGVRMRPYLRAANVTWTGLDLSDIKEMNFTEEESHTYELRPGDVLVAEASGSASEVGKPAMWRGEIEGCCFQNTLIRVRTRQAAPEYLRYFLLSEARSGRIGKAAPGVGIHHIGARRMAEWPVPVPPLNEQRRIVAAIEEHLSRLDAADASLAAALRRVSVYRAAALEIAFALEAPTATVGSFAKVGSGATPKRGRSDYWDGGTVPWVTSGQLNGEFVREPAAFITERALNETSVKLWPAGTLLVALYGEGRTRGRCAELTFEATTNQACAAIVLDESVADRNYVRRFFDAKYSENRRLASGGVQPNLSLGLIRSRLIPLPPLSEQKRIVAEVEERLSRIDAMRASIERAQRRSQALRAAILERAFRGELVPQDPSDEPAEALLARIRAERASAGALSQKDS